jgi:hypothetical protein
MTLSALHLNHISPPIVGILFWNPDLFSELIMLQGIRVSIVDVTLHVNDS